MIRYKEYIFLTMMVVREVFQRSFPEKFSREVVAALFLEGFKVRVGQHKSWSNGSLCLVKRTRLGDTETNWVFINSDAAMRVKGIG